MEKNGLKSIRELMGKHFIIPHYQRGYRWEDQEVTELLDDLWAFQKDKESGSFYCLQPIVLREIEKGNYEVLDGQQRLTTLYLLLVYLDERRKDDKLFFLNYETRKECEEFLKEKKFANNVIDDSNIDFYYICKAYQCIDKWFKNDRHSEAKSELIPVLLGETEKDNRNVQVILYEVEKDTNAIDVFIRLNVGKIPLTDAELIKALLLQSDKYPQDELEFNKMKLHNIATEWDIIETTLQDKAFWYFLNDESNTENGHIEFIFKLLANKLNKDKKYFKDMPKNHAIFLIFSEYLQDLIENGTDGKKLSRIEAIEKIWSLVVEYFEYFKEWFNNRTLYHYIGFLIAGKRAEKGAKMIEDIIQQTKLLSKTKFQIYLEEEIARMIINKKSLNDLVYEDENGKKTDYNDITKILLLHNVKTTLDSDMEKSRFPFELYKKQTWSLEHIHAQNSETIVKDEDKYSWLSEHIRSLENANNPDFEDLIQKMKEMKMKMKMKMKMEMKMEMKMKEMNSETEIDDEEFQTIFNDVFQKINKSSDLDDEKIHSIRNLCLLDKATNSRLNNSVFDVKREKIKELDVKREKIKELDVKREKIKKRELDGYYIPVCTRNVFLKAYTAYPATNAYWTEADRDGYFKSIEATYNFFVNKLKK